MILILQIDIVEFIDNDEGYTTGNFGEVLHEKFGLQIFAVVQNCKKRLILLRAIASKSRNFGRNSYSDTLIYS